MAAGWEREGGREQRTELLPLRGEWLKRGIRQKLLRWCPPRAMWVRPPKTAKCKNDNETTTRRSAQPLAQGVIGGVPWCVQPVHVFVSVLRGGGPRHPPSLTPPAHQPNLNLDSRIMVKQHQERAKTYRVLRKHITCYMRTHEFSTKKPKLPKELCSHPGRPAKFLWIPDGYPLRPADVSTFSSSRVGSKGVRCGGGGGGGSSPPPPTDPE